MQTLLHRLDMFWRLIATAISFGIFGVGGLVLGLVIFPPIWLLVRDEERRSSIGRRIVCRSFWGFVQTMYVLRVLNYKISGQFEPSDLKNCLIVANHPSLIDVVFLISMFPKVDCVVKSAMWSNPFTAATVQSAGYIRNDAPDLLIDECIKRLKKGRTLILFPEGTRSEPNKELAFKRGAATIAIRAGAKCLPVNISCEPLTLTKGEKWYQIPSRRPLFSLKILPTLSSKDYLDRYNNEKAASQKLTGDLKKILSAHLEIEEQTG